MYRLRLLASATNLALVSHLNMLTSNMEVTKILMLRLNKPTCGAEGDSVSVGQ